MFTDWFAQIRRLFAEKPPVALLIVTLIVISSASLLERLLSNDSLLLGPPRQVVSVNPKMGVHTRLTDEVEEAKIKQSLEMVREMGASWTVEYFPWAYVEREPGVFKWKHNDMVIQHAHHQGLKIVARLGFVPEWARPPETTPLYLDEENFAAFGRYAAEFAARYREQIGYIIIWNEPNLSLEWGFQPVDPEKYVRMLEVVYPMIKAANPDVQVLAGALAPTLALPGDPNGMNDLDFLQRMYEAGAAPYFDVLAIHAYGWHSAPDDPPAPDVVNLRRSELLRAVMVQNGDANKQAMITEGGWNDHPRWTRGVRPGQRIEYTIRAYEIAQQEWPWMDAMAFWAFRYPWDAKSYQDYFTFVRTDFEPKPIYSEVAKYAAGE